MNNPLCPNCAQPMQLLTEQDGIAVFQCACECVLTKAHGHRESRLNEMQQLAVEIIEKNQNGERK